ncbi:MAG TPA: DUF2993 domain-containing protein [Jatrophihabitans sp.]|nr:DUF2993 domain-containing protein [Jatrophihabitans sp.]
MSGRLARRIAIAVAVVLALLIALDRVGVYVADRAAADTIKSSQHLNSAPSVDIAGFPFLTQLISGHYDQVTISASDVPVGSGSLQLSRVHVVLHSLTVSHGFHTVHAKSADATGLITYAALSKALGVTVRYAGDGRITAAKTLTAAGVTVRGRITTRPQLRDGALAFTDTSVADAGPLGDEALNLLTRAFTVAIPLRGIPFQVRAERLKLDNTGIVLSLGGQDLAYSR